MQRVIGIDYGMQRIGVAISSETNTSAFPLTTILLTGAETAAVTELLGICREYEVRQVVIGLPLTTDGRERQMADRARSFGNALESRGDVSVSYVDERFSSQASASLMQAVGQSARQQRQVIDQVAAQQILQTYLDQHGAA